MTRPAEALAHAPNASQLTSLRPREVRDGERQVAVTGGDGGVADHGVGDRDDVGHGPLRRIRHGYPWVWKVNR
ncbi:hypothetical protein [Tessaracoccus lapidicaptus]|uniref:hypothetical protein n=1 Tax=Tessaracoccus lapidicaptus TaxID=1427523 RepID=UPI0033411995